MEIDALAERLFGDLFWPLLFGGLAAFTYLGLLARAYLKIKLILDLHRECVRLRQRQEAVKRERGDAPFLDHYRRLEKELLLMLKKEGLEQPPAPVPAAVPAAVAVAAPPARPRPS